MLPALDKLVAIDFEATQYRNRPHVVEVAAILVRKGRIDQVIETLVDPGVPIDPHTQGVHGISDGDVEGEPTFPEVWATLEPMLRDAVVIAHGAPSDAEMLRHDVERHHLTPPPMEWWCTLRLARKFWAGRFERYSLSNLAEELGLNVEVTHHAIDDTRVCLSLFSAEMEQAAVQGLDWDKVREIARVKGKFWPW